MKNTLFLIFVFPLIAFSQQGVELFVTYPKPILNRFVRDVVLYQQNGHKVDFSNFSVGVNALLYKKNRFNLRSGFSYKYLTLNVADVLDSINYTTYNGGGSTPVYATKHTFYYKDKPDMFQISHSLALNIDFRYSFFDRKHIRQDVGLASNIYFFEYYRMSSRSTESSPELASVDIDYLAQYSSFLHRKVFLSAIDLNLFYQFNWIVCEQFSVGLRASIGTNLYSDWNQFKKYMWAGFGLHIGFLKDEKVRLNKKTPMDYEEH